MQVTNLYAVGTPDDFKRLVDEAHGYYWNFDLVHALPVVD